jgi:hypothetical protein
MHEALSQRRQCHRVPGAQEEDHWISSSRHGRGLSRGSRRSDPRSRRRRCRGVTLSSFEQKEETVVVLPIRNDHAATAKL